MAEISAKVVRSRPWQELKRIRGKAKNNEGDRKRSPSSCDIREVLFANVFMVTSLRERLRVSLR